MSIKPTSNNETLFGKWCRLQNEGNLIMTNCTKYCELKLGAEKTEKAFQQCLVDCQDLKTILRGPPD